MRPGTLLVAYAVERAAQEGVETIDMLRGDEAYKQNWHMERVPTWTVKATNIAIEADSEQAKWEAA